MKKLKIILVLTLLSSFCFCGCGKSEQIDETVVDESIEDIDVQVQNSTESTISHEKTEAGKMLDEQIAELNEYYYYYPQLDSFTIKGMKAYTDEDIDEQFLLNSVLENFSDKTCIVENFEQTSPEEIITYKNGIPNISYDGEFIGYLSLDGTFQEILNEQTTSLYEWFIVQSVADIFCKNLGCEKIQITSGGNPIKTMYKEYTSDDFINFSVKIYENFDVISEEEASLGRDVEKLILMGYNITRQDFIDILNGNTDYLNNISEESVEENTDISEIENSEIPETDENIEDISSESLGDSESSESIEIIE